MAGTILRLGWTDPRTGVFGAHPLLGDVLDLNDGVTFTLLDGGLELAPPTREVALAGNPRTQGERATRAIYRHNRQARAQLILGPMASYSDLAASVRTLVRWLDAPPAVPLACAVAAAQRHAAGLSGCGWRRARRARRRTRLAAPPSGTAGTAAAGAPRPAWRPRDALATLSVTPASRQAVAPASPSGTTRSPRSTATARRAAP